MASMRPLTLHASALSDFEYDLYTSSLNDLCVTNDTETSTTARDFETTTVGVREARAWLRGRYHDLPASDIDDILRLFSPCLMPSDTLTGGQFFAALRLVIHAQSGKGVDRSLAFVQAQPGTTKPTGIPRPPSPPKRSVIAPPSHPDRSKGLSFSTSPPETNPFVRRSTEHASSVQSTVCTSSDGQSVQPAQQNSQRLSHNPFLVRDRVEGQDAVVKSSERTLAKGGKLPPLPPRKPTTSASAQQPPEVTMVPPAPLSPPLVLPKPSHIMTPLMRQSLEASKHGQTMRRVEEQLDRERVLRVLKSTSSGTSRTRSTSPSKPGSKSSDVEDTPTVPPRRRQPSSTPSSASSSLASLEQVASATLKSLHPSPSIVSPPVPAPPTHPDRRPSTGTSDSQQPSSARVFRSKSMHHADSPPLPPPRRKRPESVQLMPPSGTIDAPSSPHIPLYLHTHSRTPSYQGLSRHVSLTRGSDTTDSSPMSNIQKTISNLQSKAQPKLDAVRYKAEAGISRRGFVNHAQFGSSMRWRGEDEEGLMADTQGITADVDQDPNLQSVTDNDLSSGEDREARTRAEDSHRRFIREADNLKLPPGEGWAQL
ncbi:hypothetical protein BKA82DRAFT_22120 [Pisolithus tinctorius]|uniref:Uncharacterized protein n=1 Tax=Pisolithus tinctorius Marx 270 TaxID=870435 RepID=A0A0C3P860_PISTI|nr:hypothetical protein BKA82DRAFT_22120 [Pisolithus tinctorius]KIO09660.1 hypothetical protein M404DRAFT_22120 [Pisolithus tinctorius Marx 270]